MITVIFSSPRLIAVNVNLPGGRLQFVVAHAPHEMSEDDSKEEWWQRFEAHIGAWRNKCRMIIVGDFNARLQVPSEGRIGDRLCDGKDSNNGERLSGILDAFNLVAPSTFSCYHQGQDWTWTHPKGNHARLDYVLLQCDEAWDIHASYVETRITTSTAARDHEPVVLEVGWNFEKGRIIPKQKSYDWERMATREGRDKLRRAVASVEIPAWDTDVHEHWQVLEDGLHRVLYMKISLVEARRGGETSSGKRLGIRDKQKSTSRLFWRTRTSLKIDYGRALHYKLGMMELISVQGGEYTCWKLF